MKEYYIKDKVYVEIIYSTKDEKYERLIRRLKEFNYKSYDGINKISFPLVFDTSKF